MLASSHAAVPGLPPGWRVVELRRSDKHERDAVVMCERSVPLANQTNFVVWNVNMIEGGCTGGMYSVSESEARSNFARRCWRLS